MKEQYTQLNHNEGLDGLLSRIRRASQKASSQEADNRSELAIALGMPPDFSDFRHDSKQVSPTPVVQNNLSFVGDSVADSASLLLTSLVSSELNQSPVNNQKSSDLITELFPAKHPNNY